MATYGGGLRVSEVVRLQVSDIDAGRGMRRVEQGKGRKDRYTLLGPRLLAELRRYWQLYRPVAPWLFPKPSKPEPMPIETAQRMYYAAKERAGITKAGGIHALRHALTTHLTGRRRRSAPAATLTGPRECDDPHALRAPCPASADGPRITAGAFTRRRGGTVSDAIAVVIVDSAFPSHASRAAALCSGRYRAGVERHVSGDASRLA